MTLALPAILLLQVAVVADRPAELVRGSTHAVESDSASQATARWRAVLAGDSTNARALLALATIERLSYDFAAADRHYRAVASPASSAPPAFRAWALLGMAESRLYRLPLDTAAAWFVTAVATARAAGDSTAAASSYFGLSIARLRTTLPATALAVADSGFALIPRGDIDVAAQGHCARAAVLGFQANHKAGDEARTGLAIARQARDRRLEVFCLDMLGQYYLTINDQPRAAAAFDTAVTIARQSRDRSAAALAFWWRGHHRLEVYDHDGAQRDLSAALVDAEASGNQFMAGWAWIRLAVVSWHFSDMLSARRALARGRALVREQGDGWGMAYGRYLDGAMSLDAGQIDTAEAAFREDLAWATQLRQPLEQFSATFGLARVASARGDWIAARDRFDDASRIARDRGMTGYLPQLEYEYGIIALRTGRFPEAETRFRNVLASRSGVSDLDRYAARSRIAELHIARGEVDRAERELTEATNAIDSLRASLGDHDLRVLAFQARRGYDDVDLGFANIIAGLVAGGRVDAALALAERRRGRELRDRLVRGSGSLTRAIGSSAIRPFRPDTHTALLEFVTGTGSQPTTLFVVAPRSSTALRLPPADSIEADIAAFTGMIEAGAGASVLAKQLGGAVFGGALDAIPMDVTRLIIVADGPLQRVPFDALRMKDGRYVVERFAVSVAPSIAVAADLRSRVRATDGGARVLALGDPRFALETSPSGGAAADVYREAFSMNGGLPRLRGSAQEAKLVARFAERAELRLRERASESYLKHAALDSFDVIHLATHALVDERSVARTALAVADGDGDDGFIGPGELSALKLDARLVVLSACRTAQGVAVRGEGVQGLTAPLLAAGARSVLATQWRIRDTDAVRFIDDFYRALARGNGVSDAARTAKLAAIDRGASAATWAAFSVVGDPLVTVPVRAPSNAIRWLLVAAGLAALALVYGVVRRTRRAVDRSSVPSVSRADTVQ